MQQTRRYSNWKLCRRACVWAILFGLIFCFGASASWAQVGGKIMSRGKYCFNVWTGSAWQGGTCHVYVTVFDPGAVHGWYARVFQDGPFITQIYPDNSNPSILYTVLYNTKFKHWRTQGPGAWWLPAGEDTGRDWHPVDSGVIRLSGTAPPGVVAAPILGQWKRTYRAHKGSNQAWFPVKDQFQYMNFTDIEQNPSVVSEFRAFQDFLRNSGGRRLPPLNGPRLPPDLPLVTESTESSQYCGPDHQDVRFYEDLRNWTENYFNRNNCEDLDELQKGINDLRTYEGYECVQRMNYNSSGYYQQKLDAMRSRCESSEATGPTEPGCSLTQARKDQINRKVDGISKRWQEGACANKWLLCPAEARNAAARVRARVSRACHENVLSGLDALAVCIHQALEEKNTPRGIRPDTMIDRCFRRYPLQ